MQAAEHPLAARRAGEGSAPLAEGAHSLAGLGWRGLAGSTLEPAVLRHGEIPELHGEASALDKHPQIPVIFLPPVLSLGLLADSQA